LTFLIEFWKKKKKGARSEENLAKNLGKHDGQAKLLPNQNDAY